MHLSVRHTAPQVPVTPVSLAVPLAWVTVSLAGHAPASSHVRPGLSGAVFPGVGHVDLPDFEGHSHPPRCGGLTPSVGGGF